MTNYIKHFKLFFVVCFIGTWRNYKKKKKKLLYITCWQWNLFSPDIKTTHSAKKKPWNWYFWLHNELGTFLHWVFKHVPMGMETTHCNRLLWTSGQENLLTVSRERNSHGWNGPVWHYSKAQVKLSRKR